MWKNTASFVHVRSDTQFTTNHARCTCIVTFIIIKNLGLYETFNFSNVHENVSLACLTCNIEYLSRHRLFIVVCSILLKRITNNEISNAFNSNCKSLHGKKLALILLQCSLYDTTTEMLKSTTGN